MVQTGIDTSAFAVEDVLSPQEERIERGERLGLVTREAQRSRPRIHRMLQGFRDLPIRLNVDRARLLTESFRQTDGQATVWRWAQALAHVLRHMPIHIERDELIVGSAGPPGRYAILYPELEERFFSDDVRPSQPGDRVAISEEDVRIINEELRPYWQDWKYHAAFVNALPEATRRLIAHYFVVTPTATARSSLAWNHDYEKVLRRGLSGLRDEACTRRAALDPLDPKHTVEQAPFLDAVILVCDAIVDFARRYAALAQQMAAAEKEPRRRRELEEIADTCAWVPEHPARTFRDAVQSQWFVQTVSRLEQRIGGTVGNGRIDQYLYPYYARDLEAGRLTPNSALELLECLWIGMARGVDLYTAPGSLSYTDGYAHWEATTIGGQTREGQDATNALSHLVLQSKREFPLNYPDLAARIHARTPDRFLYDVCETIKEGTGFPKLFFDEEIVPLFLAKGAAIGEALDYCIAGCTEAKLVNRDAVTTGCAWVNLGAVVEMALHDGHIARLGTERVGIATGDARQFTSFGDVWNAFCRQAEFVMQHVLVQQYVADTLKARFIAAPLCSMLHDLCMQSCTDMHAGPIPGALYLGFVDTLGFGTAIDSLAAIKHLVFDERQVTMAELLDAVDADFAGRDALLQRCLNAPKYGNDDARADAIGRDIEEFFVRSTGRYRTAFGGELDVRYVTITAHVPFGSILGATPDGRRAGEPISEGVSPVQGADRRGPTATLVSIARTKCDARKERAARLLNVKLSPAAVAGAGGTRKLMSLVRTAGDLKMWHLQFNVINRETLLAAQRDPQRYRNLLVRVAGYSAYFVDLSPQLQEEIIRRTEHCM
jgi:pyruvate formate-lyase/glycerol dehydratase family glycyl radical enzyme